MLTPSLASRGRKRATRELVVATRAAARRSCTSSARHHSAGPAVTSSEGSEEEVPWGENDYQPVFFFDSQFPPKITRILQKAPNSRKWPIMISLSELILACFGVKQMREERGEKREREEEGEVNAAACCHALCCPVLWIIIYIYMLRRL